MKRNVNKKFAAITLDALRRMLKENPKEKPIVWIHDYHLMVAANTIRQVCTCFLICISHLYIKIANNDYKNIIVTTIITKFDGILGIRRRKFDL